MRRLRRLFRRQPAPPPPLTVKAIQRLDEYDAIIWVEDANGKCRTLIASTDWIKSARK